MHNEKWRDGEERDKTTHLIQVQIYTPACLLLILLYTSTILLEVQLMEGHGHGLDYGLVRSIKQALKVLLSAKKCWLSVHKRAAWGPQGLPGSILQYHVHFPPHSANSQGSFGGLVDCTSPRDSGISNGYLYILVIRLVWVKKIEQMCSRVMLPPLLMHSCLAIYYGK